MARTLTAVLSLILCAMVLAGVDPRAYTLSGRRWGTTNVNYYINPSNRDMSQSAAIAAIQNAAANWSEQSTANIRLVYAGVTSGSSLAYNGKNEVFLRNATSGSTAAVTYYWMNSSNILLDSDTVFYDAGFKFFPGSSGCSGGLYLEDIATHEFGHTLGLQHSSISAATMYATFSSWCFQSWRALASDDIAGIQRIYPPTSTSTMAPAVPVVYLPANYATRVTDALTNGAKIRWYSTARATSYDVYYGTSSNPPRVATVVPPSGVSTWAPGTMYLSVSRAPHTTYYWRVVAKNSAGSTSGPVWRFTML